MVRKGSEFSPLMRRSASISPALVIVFSANGMPRPLSRARAALQGSQLLEVYSVTGYLLATWRNSNGNVAPPAPIVGAAIFTVATLAAPEDGLSEKVIRPSGPTKR